jgi:transposase-like protein
VCQEIGHDESFHRKFRLGRERVKIFAVDETGIVVAGKQAFLFIAYEPFEDRILELDLAWNPSSLSVEMFLRDLVKKYGRHPVWADAGDWCPPAGESMNLKHHLYGHGS